jgi:LmbE family N-acetylglucosaminyl deacetylase
MPHHSHGMNDLKALLGRTLVIVAHPDDEAVGCGALLQRMRDPVVVFATDGAPKDKYFWGRYGSREAYAKLREKEARQALGIVGVQRVHTLGAPAHTIVDQELFRCLSNAVKLAIALIDEVKPEALLTLSYEGGHPDHDSCNFLAYVLGRRRSLPIWEMPLYHRSTDGVGVFQEFLGEGEEIVLQPTPEEIEKRKQMLRTYVSQGEMLQHFPATTERFRPLGRYDYSKPPHPGVLNYEAWQWPITGSEVAAAFSNFLQQERGIPATSG